MFSSTTKDDTVTNLKNTGRELKNDLARDIGNDLQSAANKAGRKVRNLYDTASDEIAYVSDTVSSEIRSNPVRSSAIALAAGVLLGMLMRR